MLKKDQLRKELKKKRLGLSKDEVLLKSALIKDRLFDMREFKDARVVLFYVSYDNEVFTHDMIKKCMMDGKTVVVPVSDKTNRCLILSELVCWDDLEVGSYGILEPKKECIKKTKVEDVDIVIVPGVGFDKNGNRIGHGGGYYDMFLKSSKNSLHVGLCFELQLVDAVPVERHDVGVDIIVTEKRVINCC